MVAENVVVLLMTSSRGYLIVLSTWFHFFFSWKTLRCGRYLDSLRFINWDHCSK